MKSDIDENRIYGKYLIIDVHAPSGSVCFYKATSTGENHDFTYNVNWATVFDDKKSAEAVVKADAHHTFLCPNVVDYRMASAIARELSKTHRFEWGDHVGEYIC